MSEFSSITIIGLGLIGSSIARAVREYLPDVNIVGFDADEDIRERAGTQGFCHLIAETAGTSVSNSDLVILCVPVGKMGVVATDIASDLPEHAIITDVGSSKASVAKAILEAIPSANLVPAHPVSGTEKSGPEAGFATLFKDRWCIITPLANTDETAVKKVSAFWEALGSNIEIMEIEHHDMVLAITSHLPHLIAYSIVGTASDLEDVTRSEVIKYSAGGFRDFTRIAASDPTMWRDVFLANKDAVLEMLQRFSEDLSALQRAIRWDKGDDLHELFTKTRAVRRRIIEEGQDDAAPDFGRSHD